VSIFFLDGVRVGADAVTKVDQGRDAPRAGKGGRYF